MADVWIDGQIPSCYCGNIKNEDKGCSRAWKKVDENLLSLTARAVCRQAARAVWVTHVLHMHMYICIHFGPNSHIIIIHRLQRGTTTFDSRHRLGPRRLCSSCPSFHHEDWNQGKEQASGDGRGFRSGYNAQKPHPTCCSANHRQLLAATQ